MNRLQRKLFSITIKSMILQLEEKTTYKDYTIRRLLFNHLSDKTQEHVFFISNDKYKEIYFCVCNRRIRKEKVIFSYQYYDKITRSEYLGIKS